MEPISRRPLATARSERRITLEFFCSRSTHGPQVEAIHNQPREAFAG